MTVHTTTGDPPDFRRNAATTATPVGHAHNTKDSALSSARHDSSSEATVRAELRVLEVVVAIMLS
jgi:hypothetical protein